MDHRLGLGRRTGVFKGSIVRRRKPGKCWKMNAAAATGAPLAAASSGSLSLGWGGVGWGGLGGRGYAEHKRAPNMLFLCTPCLLFDHTPAAAI